MRAKVPPLKTEEGFCGPCNKPRCEICKHITKRHQSELSSTKRIYSIRPQNLNCASKNVVFTFLLVKPVINNIQETLKNFRVNSIIADVGIGTFLRTNKLNKSHFTLIFQKAFTKEKEIGKLD